MDLETRTGVQLGCQTNTSRSQKQPIIATSESRKHENELQQNHREVAEGEGFEPPVGFILRLISSQVP